MNSLNYKIIALLLLFSGEALSVLAEMLAAHAHSQGTQSFQTIFSKTFLTITLAGALLIAGYMAGLKAFDNIWVVTALSVTAILIIEPVIAYVIFRTMPTRGALLGLVLGALGFVVSFK